MSNVETMKEQGMSKETTLTTDTRITFALLALLVSPLLVGVVLYFKVDSLQRDVRGSWTVPQQILWSERLGAQNPSLKVPPVDDVLRLVNRAPGDGMK